MSLCALCLGKVVCIMYALAALVLVCIDVMVMSSAGEVTYTGACGMSDVYRLNNMVERKPPWGTPVLNWRVVDVWFLNVV